MTQSREEKAAYAKGYAAGQKGRWPPHRPPLPPDPLISRLIATARAMRDAMDSELAKFGEGDEIALTVGPAIDAYDAVMVDITKWLNERPQP